MSSWSSTHQIEGVVNVKRIKSPSLNDGNNEKQIKLKKIRKLIQNVTVCTQYENTPMHVYSKEKNQANEYYS